MSVCQMPPKLFFSCSSLMTGMISGKPSMPLMKGYSTDLAEALSEGQKLAGGRSWSRKKITLCLSQTWRMLPMTLSPGSDARSIPKICAPIEPDRRTSKPFVAITIAVAAVMSRVPHFNIVRRTTCGLDEACADQAAMHTAIPMRAKLRRTHPRHSLPSCPE